ncbi:MAG: Flp pilus assembly complex ATPase component TadA [Lachnospiraceae bacterium]|nr:Flp pilus assembly complex ATPase component TadA [Lachnospiraceae bacterium]
MARTKLKIGDLLVQAGVLTEEQLKKALAYSKEQYEKGNPKRLGECLKELRFASDQEIAKALARQLNLQLVDLQGFVLTDELRALVKGSILRTNTVLPVAFDPKDPMSVYLAMADPLDYNALDDIEMLLSPRRVIPCVATASAINTVLDHYFGNEEAQKAAERFTKENKVRQEAVLAAQAENERQLGNAPIVQLLKQILEAAVRDKASDVHFDALERQVRIRYRIDGVLQDKSSYDISLLPAFSTRIKILSGLDIAEKRKPQDGRMTIEVEGVEYDIRVAILPTSFGEKIVMRITVANALTKAKSELGIQPYEMARFNRILKRPNGIILVTGPTGSGKSTTLYTALSELNTSDVNIMTVEDPVEANVPGINQVQVNVKAGLTFASALRSFLRQDPDIIMVGEIRDRETAEIAVQASITGHLVVSTVHTNSSAATITRMVDMGVEPYLLADSLVGIIAQRLVRRLCENCKEEREATDFETRVLGLDPEGKHPKICVAHPDGCNMCHGTGYKGRIGIYEIMEMTSNLRNIVAAGKTTQELEEAAKEEGLRTLRQNAAEFVLQGLTSVEEMLKVTVNEAGINETED